MSERSSDDVKGRRWANRRERLIAEGKLIPAKRRLADLGPPLPVRGKMSVSQALEELREERLP